MITSKSPYGETWLRAYRELCRLYGISIVGVSNVGWITDGPWKGRKVIGCSLAVGPMGEVLAKGALWFRCGNINRRESSSAPT